MASKRKVWPLNQSFSDDDGFAAEILRAQHHAATSGGTGVDHPTAMKVVAKAAPDNTVLIIPGGGTVESPFAGADGQSYYIPHMEALEVEVAPTGASERHDVVVMQFADAQYGTYPPGAPQRELTPEEASQYDWYWPEVHQNRSAGTVFDFPHLKLAQIRRGPNKTIVEDDDIRDLRVLANPKNHLHMRANNLSMSDAQSLHTGTRVWPEEATHMMRIPEWATHVQIHAAWGTVHTHRQASDHGPASGQVQVSLVLDGEGTINTQQSTWRTDPGQGYSRFNIVLGDNRPIPERFRGQEVRVELRGNKTYGPNVYMDGDSTWTVQLYFEQEVV